MNKINMFACMGILGLVGCANKIPDHYVVGIDPGFSNVQKSNIITAIDRWGEILNGEMTYDVQIGCDKEKDGRICIHATTIENIYNDCPNLKDEAGLLACTIAWTNHGADIYIPTDDTIATETSLQVQIISHEFGHALGLKHTYQYNETGEGAIMCANIGCATNFITCKDVQQYQWVHNMFQVDCKDDADEEVYKDYQL